MCVRKVERDWGSDLDDLGWADIDDITQPLWNPGTFDEDDFRSPRINVPIRLGRGRDVSIHHTPTTDFGAPSLANFLQNQVEKATAAGTLGTAKGKEHLESGFPNKNTGNSQHKQTQAANSNGFMSSTASPGGLRVTTRRSTKPTDRPTGASTGARSSDFAQHTQQVRNRARSEQDLPTSIPRAVSSASGPRDRTNVNADPAAGRRRTVHGRHDTPGIDLDFSTSDGEVSDNFGSLNSLMGMLGTDSDSDSSSEAEDDFADRQLRRLNSRRTRTKPTRRDSCAMTTNKPDIPARVSESPPQPATVTAFEYPVIVPVQKPKIFPRRRKAAEISGPAIASSATTADMTISLGRRARSGRVSTGPITKSETMSEENSRPARTAKNSGRQQYKLVAMNDISDRVWDAHYPPTSEHAPPTCPADITAPPRNLTSSAKAVLPFTYDVWNDVAKYLSLMDVRNLRLTCHGFAREIAPLMLRSVVTTFSKTMFSNNPTQSSTKNNTTLETSMLAKYGDEIRKFGISFEYDLVGLAYAEAKITEKRQQAWYGSYRWPVESYPRFVALQEIEDLVDENRPLLKDSLACLTGASELALSLDSGHGWLCGADVADLTVFELRRTNGTKVFGESFQEDTWHAFGRAELFKWAQENSINETLKHLSMKPDTVVTRRNISDFKNMEVREYESFIDEKSQHDFDPFSHTGDKPPPLLNRASNRIRCSYIYREGNIPHFSQYLRHSTQFPTSSSGGVANRLRSRTDREREHQPKKSILSQWPIIFNGYNIAADVGGRMAWIQNKVARPADFPLKPGCLTEAQVQWLMETAWAQRAFLSAYTTAVILNKDSLAKVHTLTIAKISSGLLPSLTQPEFWASLAGLKRLKILVSPDWRNEHVPGDKFFATHMLLSPVMAASKFAEFLRRYVSQLENLSHLTIGYIGNGENATGLFARNQHLLPAPITEDPCAWITDHIKKPDPSTLCKFKHIRDLTFENCWFSPCMLETFMEKSRDTSLHTLVLDSVSMLSRHSTGIDGPLSTVRNGLKCRFDETDWLHEEVPSSATWTGVLDKITPGVTMLERKHAAGMFDEEKEPVPTKEFRGNVQQIVLKSCGYAKISGVKGDQFNQNALVVQSVSSMDTGLHSRRRLFEKWHISEEEDTSGTNPGSPAKRAQKDLPVMMSLNDPATGNEWFGLGTLTQCVHPIEKRILEKAWHMSFGWGNKIERWASVDDGWYEGGTGRFSGVVERDNNETTMTTS